ncbi:hypothetical protein SELMODRAFT_136102 [Selaginella moellendorffii]|uniref:non-specific serine/threonine protein kinase n=2 Tax=Selaginella moellendorffii TaxID=88036 RepID=D8TBB6_SELML|nr:hypothetical protein SELMODRAFT_136102 [Selaginella moellendorffii]
MLVRKLCFIVVTVAALIRCCAADPPEQEALREFLLAAKGSELLKSWSTSSSSPCSWLGVSCSSNGHVVELSLGGLPLYGRIPTVFGFLSELKVLNLSSTNLTGSIPEELGSCSKLQLLDLSVNSLTGRVPSSIGRLKELRSLNLQDNQLQGSIPKEIGNCTSLEELQLFDNQLNGSIPPEIGQLGKLQAFRAGGNMALSGPLPPELSNCRNLTVLGLAVTALSGSIPGSYGELKNLESLILYGAGISGRIPPELGGCTKLQSIYLYENRLTGPIPPELGRLKQLRSLLVWQNAITGSVPRELSQCPLLEVIDFSSNDLSGDIPPEIGMLRNLQQFYLSQNNITGIIPPELGNCSSLTFLELDTNMLTGPIPPELGQLSNLKLLHLWQNKLTGNIPASLGRCSLLEMLDLSMNQLTGTIPAEIFNLSKLQRMLLLFNNLSGTLPNNAGNCISLLRLRLNNNMLSGSLPISLGQLRNLNFLDLHDNMFSGPLPTGISNLSSLQMLDVHDNQLSGPFPAEFGSLSNLEILDASFNNLSGPIPAEIGKMNLLSQLNLSMNQLSGNIPPEMGRCKELLLLDLSSNQLSGNLPPDLGMITSLTITLDLHKNRFIGLIPSAFARLSQLERLDISSNELTGNLDVLGKLNSLNFVNVSFNHFSGSLPSTQVFQTMGLNSYMGNPGLCSFSSSGNSCTLTYAMGSSKKSSIKPIIGLLFGGAAFILFMGLILLYKKCHPYDDQNFRDHQHDIPWPWKITFFQRLNFTMDDVLKNLVDTNIIGQGRSGVVYKAAMPSGEVVAVKKLRRYDRSEHNQSEFTAEINTLGKIRHRNIVRLLGYCTNKTIELLMYDYMPNGSLADFLQEKKTANNWEIRYKIALGAAQGLSYLHHDCVPAILHRDIKPNNILLDSRYEPYVADFGLAKLIGSSTSAADPMSKVAGSYGYIAPEYSYTLKISEKSDVYSYGVVLLELLTGREAVVQDIHIVKWVQGALRGSNPSVEVLDPRLRGMPDLFIDEMLQILGVALMCVSQLPADRPSMKDVVAFLQEVKHIPEEASSIKVPAAAPAAAAGDQLSDQMPLFCKNHTASTYEFVFDDNSSSQSGGC